MNHQMDSATVVASLALVVTIVVFLVKQVQRDERRHADHERRLSLMEQAYSDLRNITQELTSVLADLRDDLREGDNRRR